MTTGRSVRNVYLFRLSLSRLFALTVALVSLGVLANAQSPPPAPQASARALERSPSKAVSSTVVVLSQMDLLSISSAIGSCMLQLLPAIIITLLILFFEFVRDPGLLPRHRTFRLVYWLLGALVSGACAWLALLVATVVGVVHNAVGVLATRAIVALQCAAAFVALVVLLAIVRELFTYLQLYLKKGRAM